MKAILEKIEPGLGQSFVARRFENTSCDAPQWHFHPEYEIVYIPEGKGNRHIGDHIGSYQQGELIFLGPNLPHLSYSNSKLKIVVQMRADFLGDSFLQKPELQNIQRLFERAQSGLVFHKEVKHEIGQKLIELVDEPPLSRLLTLISVLEKMATTEDSQSLHQNGFAFEVNTQDHDRMEAIYTFVQENFQRTIALDEIAATINMTSPAFCRYFKKLTNRTFTQFVNEHRIIYACSILRDENLSIAAVSFESGFNNLSHFNKQFRQIAGVSPREYRQDLRKVVR